MSTTLDGFSRGADFLQKLFSARYGKTKIIVGCGVFIGSNLRGYFDRFGANTALALTVALALMACAVVVAGLDGWQKVKSRTPEARFRRLTLALEAHFKTITSFGPNPHSGPLAADRLAEDLIRLGVHWITSERLLDPNVVRYLISLARNGLLDEARKDPAPDRF